MSVGLFVPIAGINAFFAKMDVTANNVANSNTDGYKRRIPRIEEGKNGLPGAVVAIDRAPGLEYSRQAGEVVDAPREMSNVDYAEEAVRMIEAETGVKANVKALQIAGETYASLLDIFA